VRRGQYHTWSGLLAQLARSASRENSKAGARARVVVVVGSFATSGESGGSCHKGNKWKARGVARGESLNKFVAETLALA